jgi:hypothetical protein
MNMTMGTPSNFMIFDDGAIINTEDICCVERTDNNEILLTMKHNDINIALSEHDYQMLVKKLIME